MTTAQGLGVLVSGRGSNLEAILEARARGRLPLPIRLVVSDRADAPALEHARRAGIAAVAIDPGPGRSTLTPGAEAQCVRSLREAGVDLVALAGFMRILRGEFLSAYEGRILNIHPSLLPAFPGLDAPGQAHRWGVRWTGCTVHFVTAGVDAGPIVAQAAVPVLPGDTPESLAARILVEEHRLYPEAIARIAGGGYRLEGRRIVFIDESPDVPGAGTRDSGSSERGGV